MKKLQNTSNYDDILYLEHHVSEKRAPMPIADRAAQFSPFAALTGYDDVVKETARLTQAWIEQDESVVADLDRQLRFLKENMTAEPMIEVTYFLPDEKKAGGEYVTVIGRVKKIKEYERRILVNDELWIPIDYIQGISIL